ncbi:hypothetical protein IWX49DRAFT_613765 [Phyllosticta citricarpa]|uniref:SH3 domain-containing protein n=2 Tax=Phyllosticta TaxID=121621 RepID=A0ABR1MFF3_9PEZI
MQRIQRKVGSFLPRGENDAQVATMLAEFKEVDQMLGKLLDATKNWRDAWSQILNHEHMLVCEFDALYKPINAVGEISNSGHVPSETPRETAERTAKLKNLYTDLKNDLNEDISLIDQRLLRPMQNARQSIKPMFKSMQKREDKKLDYERYKSRAEKLENSANRSARDDSALAKHRIDMDRTFTEFEAADHHLQSHLPRVTAAVLSLLPFLLASVVEVQNSLVASLYTVQHEYCQEFGFPSPPPEMSDVLGEWDATFTPLRKELETSFKLLVNSNVVRQPMELPEQKHDTYSGFNLRNKASDNFNSGRARLGSRPSFNSLRSSSNTTAGEENPPPKPPRPRGGPPSPEQQYSSTASSPVNLATRPKVAANKPRIPSSSSPSSTLTPYDGNFSIRRPSTANSYSPAPPYPQDPPDYFTAAQQRPHSNGATTPGAPSNGAVPTPLQGLAAGIGAKKKPPPPPPKKKFDLPQPRAEYVTALYDFDGQGPGDLAFREGDRIRVVKKDGDAMDSWWQGELRGVQGSFPANYCRAG